MQLAEHNRWNKKYLKKHHILYHRCRDEVVQDLDDRGVSCLMSIFFPLYPWRAIRVVLCIAKRILILTFLTTSQYLSFLFLAMRSANLLTNWLHSFDIPPDVRNTARVRVAFSTFNILSRYSSFLSFSFILHTSWKVFVKFDKQLGCETLMSRRVSSNGFQTPLADTSSQDWSPVLEVETVTLV